MKRWLHKRIDNYIIKHHSDEYIRRSMIQEEIKKRIDSAVEYNDTLRDIREAEKIEAQAVKFDIERAGLLAEIDKMKGIVKKVIKMRDELRNLYFRTKQRAKEISMISAENHLESVGFIESISASAGKLDIIERKAADICKEIDNNSEKDERVLGVK